MNDVLDWVLYARDEVHNVTTVYVNQYLKAQRVLDPGRLPTAMIGLIANHFGSAEHQLLPLPAGQGATLGQPRCSPAMYRTANP